MKIHYVDKLSIKASSALRFCGWNHFITWSKLLECVYINFERKAIWWGWGYKLPKILDDKNSENGMWEEASLIEMGYIHRKLKVKYMSRWMKLNKAPSGWKDIINLYAKPQRNESYKTAALKKTSVKFLFFLWNSFSWEFIWQKFTSLCFLCLMEAQSLRIDMSGLIKKYSHDNLRPTLETNLNEFLGLVSSYPFMLHGHFAYFWDLEDATVQVVYEDTDLY